MTLEKDEMDETKPPFVDLTEFCSLQALEDVDEYLMKHLDLSQGKVRLEEAEVGLFTAKGYKHADAIDLTDRDTSVWCQDAYRPYNGAQDFKVCRGHRGDPQSWRRNVNARLLPGVIDFLENLPFFEQTGKISIICNQPNTKGVEHADIDFDDFVSEFLWIRTKSSTKQFYVRDLQGNRHFVSGQVTFFDDHLLHGIEACDSPNQFSIRVDGRFRSEFRELLSEKATFARQQSATPVELSQVFVRQLSGPAFLDELNDPPKSEDDEDDDDDEEEQPPVDEV